MAKLKGEFQTDNGDILYPHTSSDVVFMSDGKTVEKNSQDLLAKIGSPFGAWLDNPDYNTLIDFQRYRIGGGTNSPGGGVWYLEVNPVQSGIVFQRAKCVYGGNIGQVKERVLKDGQWSEWEQLAITSKTDFTFENGWKNAELSSPEPLKIIKTGNILALVGTIQGTVFDSWTVVGTLPVGFRPSVPCEGFLVSYNNPNLSKTARLFIEPSGRVSCHNLEGCDSGTHLTINCICVI